MQYDAVITNPRWRTDAILKIVDVDILPAADAATAAAVAAVAVAVAAAVVAVDSCHTCQRT